MLHLFTNQIIQNYVKKKHQLPKQWEKKNVKIKQVPILSLQLLRYSKSKEKLVIGNIIKKDKSNRKWNLNSSISGSVINCTLLAIFKYT